MTVATRHMTSTATVRPLQGEGAHGPVFGVAVDVPCWPEQGTKQVVTAGGEETTSSTRLWCEAVHEPLFTVGSSVLFAGRPSEVIAASVHDPGAVRLPRLLEVALR
jgi:hypothetical protein